MCAMTMLVKKAIQGELVLVTRHAQAKHVRLNGQVAKQRVFLGVLHMVFNAGFKHEVHEEAARCRCP